MRRSLLLLLIVAAPLSGGARRRAVVVPPPFPSCAVVTGSPAVTFTRDDGRTVTPLAERIQGTGYTYGLAALDTPGVLLSFHKLTLSISTDDGCSWRPVASVPSVDFPPSIIAAPGGRAYVWSDHRLYIARYDVRGLHTLKVPVAIVGIGVDEKNADHVRVGTTDGGIWDSTNGGDKWTVIGVANHTSMSLYRIAFDPHDIDHILAGGPTIGAQVTFDGGRTWTKSNIADGFNAFNIAISPADGNIVWMMALEVSQTDVRPSLGRHIFRSEDGGTTFRSVIDNGAGVTLVNGPVMAPHPRDPGILYFVFGASFGGYGTDLYRYDASMDRLSVTNNPISDIDSIAFSRTDPRVIYIGLESETID